MNLCDNIYIVLRRTKNKIQDLKRFILRRLSVLRYVVANRSEARMTRGNIFLIYTMGKVASLSVLDSITRRVPHVNTFAMHFLTPQNLENQEILLAESGVVGNVMHKDIHSRHALKILRCIADNRDKRIKIVTIVREPLSQIISQIFQQLNLYDIEFYKHLSLESANIDYSFCEKWCNDELYSLFEIDILNEPFDKERGYSIYSNEKCDLLVIKFDVIGDVYQEAMEQLSGISDWTLSRVNISSKKRYSEEYKRFKSELTVDSQLLEFLYKSHYVNHFYSEEEIEMLKNRWQVA